MGVEWEIGCERCRRYIWLGSQKPLKWCGFQVGDDVVRRFLALHAASGHCQLRLTNDGVSEPPWEEQSPDGWREDILSRTFWDSWSADGLVCGQCQAAAPADLDTTSTPIGLRKNRYLWFCTEACLAAFVDFQSTQRETFIYDSSGDAPPVDPPADPQGLLTVACLDCKHYTAIDQSVDAHGMTRDMEYLAHFLGEHIGEHRLVALFTGPDEGPGHADDTWTLYTY